MKIFFLNIYINLAFIESWKVIEKLIVRKMLLPC